MRYANVTSETAGTLLADMGRPAFNLLALAGQQACILGRQDRGGSPFALPTGFGLPWVVIVRDGSSPSGRAQGPDGFHAGSLAALLRAAFAASFVTREVGVESYDASAILAITGRSSVLIETDAEQVGAWTAFVEAVAPGKICSLELVDFARWA